MGISGGKGGAKATAVVVTEQVRAELVAHAPQGVVAGQPVWVGLQLAHQPEWHTYWKNSGDSGLPTTLDWKLPAGVTAGDIAWPTPKKIPIANLANYGFEGTVVLPVPLTIAPDFTADKLSIQLSASWLVCRQECIPQEGVFALTLPTRGSTAGSAAGFERAFAQAPKPHAAGALVLFKPSATPAPGALQLSVGSLPQALNGKTLQLFSETPGVIQTAAATAGQWSGDIWTATVPLDPQRADSPKSLPFVITTLDVNASTQAVRVEAQLSGAWPPAAAQLGVSPTLDAALKANAAKAGPVTQGGSGSSLTFVGALLGAILGGLILNLMPCVFPILSLKLFSLAQMGGDAASAKKQRLTNGLAYTAGVVLSFIALAGLLLALRAGGEAVGWGFQLQSPAVVAFLALLFTVLALNFAGVFEFGQFVPSGLAGFQAKNPAVDSALSGILAVAIASPCTAPFMGASLGFAVGLPAAQALLVFAAMGLGLALPFLVVSVVPGAARWLPRPGAWMETFRRVMVFPMLATVVWLVWVLGQQTSIDGAAALLMLLLAVAFVVWSWTQVGRTKVVFTAISIAVFACGYWAMGQKLWEVPEPEATGLNANADQGRAGAPFWQAWKPGQVDQLLAAGRPVFVDFTAAWCVTCQYNKKTTLASAEVLADFKAKKVALLRADWTRRDPAITEALTALGRSGVPVYVVYKPGAAPVVLSEIISVSDVREQLAKL